MMKTEKDKIIFDPKAEIPESELWLYKNPQAYESVQRGLDQAASGKVKRFKKNFLKFIHHDD